jgi:hypothetical protein
MGFDKKKIIKYGVVISLATIFTMPLLFIVQAYIFPDVKLVILYRMTQFKPAYFKNIYFFQILSALSVVLFYFLNYFILKKFYEKLSKKLFIEYVVSIVFVFLMMYWIIVLGG